MLCSRLFVSVHDSCLVSIFVSWFLQPDPSLSALQAPGGGFWLSCCFLFFSCMWYLFFRFFVCSDFLLASGFLLVPVYRFSFPITVST